MPRNDPRLRAGLALVTGAGSGLGRALAIELAGRGLPVVGLGRRADALAETTHLAGPGFHAFPCDIADFDALRAAFAKADAIAPLTLLINNAALYPHRDFLDDGPGPEGRPVEPVAGLRMNLKTVVQAAVFP